MSFNASVAGLGTANPPLYMSQEELHESVLRNFKLTDSERSLYRKLLLEGRIKGRHFGLESPDDIAETSHDKLIGRYTRHATACGSEAARRAMKQAGTTANDITGIVVNSCTGYLCPGLTSYLAEELGLKHSIGALDIMGMGCGAALPNLDAAASMLEKRGGAVLSVAVEICSSTIFPSHEPELIVSNCIFGDGAAAAVLKAHEAGSKGEGIARVLDFESGLYPERREELRYRTVGGLLRNTLSRRVPAIGGKAVKEISERLLERQGLKAADIDFWAIHPGGTQVLDQAQRKLALPDSAMESSYGVFEDFGNMSSPSVLFVLDRIVRTQRPRKGQRAMLLSFGAGFSAFAMLLEFDRS